MPRLQVEVVAIAGAAVFAGRNPFSLADLGKPWTTASNMYWQNVSQDIVTGCIWFNIYTRKFEIQPREF